MILSPAFRFSLSSLGEYGTGKLNLARKASEDRKTLLDSARKHLDEAIQIFEPLTAKDQQQTTKMLDIALAESLLATALFDQKDFANSLLYPKRGIDRLKHLREATPSDQRLQVFLSQVCQRAAWNELLLNLIDPAGELATEAESALPNEPWPLAMLAHIELFSEQIEIVEMLYLKGAKRFGTDFLNTVASDFGIMKKQGVLPKEAGRIIEILKSFDKGAQ